MSTGPRSKRRQKDVEARWAKKYGYQNHIGTDRDHELIRGWTATAASVHGCRVFDELIDPDNTGADVWADSAYRCREQQQALAAQDYRSHLHRKAQADKLLSRRANEANRKRRRLRARVEHIFGQQAAMDGKRVRAIGSARAQLEVRIMNRVYNIRRMRCLENYA